MAILSESLILIIALIALTITGHKPRELYEKFLYLLDLLSVHIPAIKPFINILSITFTTLTILLAILGCSLLPLIFSPRDSYPYEFAEKICEFPKFVWIEFASSENPIPRPTPRPPLAVTSGPRKLPHEITLEELGINEDQSSIFFDYNSSSINDLNVIYKWANVIKNNNKLTFFLEETTDGVGSVEYNLDLGEKRMNAVLNALSSFGADTTQIKTVDFSKDRYDICGTDRNTGDKSNRCIRISVSDPGFSPHVEIGGTITKDMMPPSGGLLKYNFSNNP